MHPLILVNYSLKYLWKIWKILKLFAHIYSRSQTIFYKIKSPLREKSLTTPDVRYIYICCYSNFWRNEILWIIIKIILCASDITFILFFFLPQCFFFYSNSIHKKKCFYLFFLSFIPLYIYNLNIRRGRPKTLQKNKTKNKLITKYLSGIFHYLVP